MTRTELLMTTFTGRLESCEEVDVKLQPVEANARTFLVTLRSGLQVVVRFQANHQRPARPFVQEPDLREPSLEEVMDAIQELYAMVAWNGSVIESNGGLKS